MSNFGPVQTIYNTSDDGAVSGTTTTRYVPLGKAVGYSVSAVSTNESSFSSTVSLEGSVDGENFVTVTDSSTAHVGNTTTLFDITRTSIQFVRVKISSVSGSADFVIKIFAKGD